MGSLNGFTFEKGLKEMFSQIRRSAGRVPQVRKRKSRLGPFTYGVDYFDTFSPVAKLTSIWLFISLAATHGWDLHQLDIKNVFLHGDLVEEVYMEQPLVFVAQGEIGRVCRLQKIIIWIKTKSLCMVWKIQ